MYKSIAKYASEFQNEIVNQLATDIYDSVIFDELDGTSSNFMDALIFWHGVNTVKSKFEEDDFDIHDYANELVNEYFEEDFSYLREFTSFSTFVGDVRYTIYEWVLYECYNIDFDEFED